MGLLEGKSDQLPLYRKWVRQFKKGQTIPPLQIEKISLSSSGEWIVVTTTEAIALLNYESKVGQSFWGFVETLEGELKELVVVPTTGKLGFDIEIGEEIGFWEQEIDVVSFSIEKGGKNHLNSITRLSIENMKPTMTTSSVKEKNENPTATISGNPISIPSQKRRGRQSEAS